MNDRRGSAVRRGNSMQMLANLRSNGIAHASQQVTLTCYIPPNRVGAVIGRRGATILHIQREAVKQSRGHTSAVRVSIMGSHDVPHRTSVNEDTSNKQIHLVQLEGDLDHVQEFCAHMLSIVCSVVTHVQTYRQTDIHSNVEYIK